MQIKHTPKHFSLCHVFRWVAAVSLLNGVLQLFAMSFIADIHAQESTHDSADVGNQAEEHLRLGIDFFMTNELEVAIDEFREAARLRPGYADAFHNLGVALAKTGDLKGAIAAWSKAQRLDPHSVAIHYHLSALVSYNYGVSLLHQGDLESAMTEWRKSLKIQPDLAEAHYALGLGHLTKGNSQRAATKFQEALISHPGWAEGHFQLGVAYYESREFDAADHEWAIALGLKPNFAPAYSNIGLVHLLEGMYTRPRRPFVKRSLLNPILLQRISTWALPWLRRGNGNRHLIILKPFFGFNQI